MAVVITFYDSLLTEDVRLQSGNVSRQVADSLGRMLSSLDVVTTSAWELAGEVFVPTTRNGSGGVFVATNRGTADVLVYVGKNRPEAPYYDVLMAGTQRSFGIAAGHVVMLKDAV